nr:hypothetical protein [Tanacetum cinerariifolium]
SGNDTDADNADIKPIYDEEPMAKVQLTAEFSELLSSVSEQGFCMTTESTFNESTFNALILFE